MQFQARVLEVYDKELGNGLAEDAPLGSDRVTVFSSSEFDEDGGSFVFRPSGLGQSEESFEELGTVYQYTGIEEGEEFDTLILAFNTLEGHTEGESVSVFPIVMEKLAKVRHDDDDVENLDIEMESEDTIARVSPIVADTLEVRAWERNEGPYVSLDDQSGDWEVVRVYGQDGSVIAGNITGVIPIGNIPVDELDITPQEPVAPDFTPEIEVRAGIGTLVISWVGVYDPVTPVVYDVHDVTDTSDAITEDTLQGSTGATSWFVATEEPRRYRIWARSGLELAPEPSDAVGGTPKLVGFDQASQAVRDAISQASTDAAAAQSTAGSAQQEAEQARSDAEAAGQAALAAAGLAQGANTTAQAASAATDAILKAANDLVLNGSGELGTDQYFTILTRDAADAPPGAACSFWTDVSSTTRLGDQLIPINPTKNYRFSFSARQRVSGIASRMYGLLSPHDAFGNAISTAHYMYLIGSLTTLAQPLNPGDTTVTLASAANWSGVGSTTGNRRLIFWDYVDAGGKAWPTETYSRNVTNVDTWAPEALVGNVITLRAPYSGPAKAAGTKVSNGSSGGTYMYMPVNVIVPDTWTAYSGVVGGVNRSGSSSSVFGVAGAPGASVSAGFPPGCTAVKVGWLMNRDVAGGAHAVGGISLSDASAAQDAADIAKAAAATAQAAAVTADGKAVTADGKAVAAQSAAATADGKAVAAATAASTADGKAVAAQTTANSKGETIIQPSAPTGSRAVAQNLWINTTPLGSPPLPRNTPNRWNGTAWEPITDKVAVDAAAAAVAAKDAADAADAKAVAAKTQADAALDKATQAQASADGKNRNRYGPAITTGTPTTPAGTTDGDIYWGRNAAGNTVQQWRRVGSTWVSEKVDGAVLANLDASSITTGTLNVALLLEAESILARIVGAQQITADMVSTEILIANQIYAKNGLHVGLSNGPGYDMDANGWNQRDVNGDLRVSFPTDPNLPNIIDADMKIRSASAQKFVMLGPDNLIQRNSRLLMASSTEPPTALAVTHYWPASATAHDPASASSPWGRGMLDVAYHSMEGSNARMYGIRTTVTGSGETAQFNYHLVKFLVNPDTAEPVGSVTVLRDIGIFALIEVFNGDLWVTKSTGAVVERYNTNGVYIEGFNRPFGGYEQGMFQDGTSIKFWRQSSSTRLSIWTFNTSTGAITNQVDVPWDYSQFGGIVKIISSTFDLGSSKRYMVVPSDGSPVRCFTSTWTRSPNFDFEQPQGRSTSVVEWIEGKRFISTGFYLSSTVPLFHRFTAQFINDTEDDTPTRTSILFGATWARNSTLTYQTLLGEFSSVSLPARSATQVRYPDWPPESAPPDPTDVTHVAIYARHYTDWRRQVVLGDRTKTTWTTEAIKSAPASGESAPTVSTFPVSVSGFGLIASASGGLALYGNGGAKKARTPVDWDDIPNKEYVDDAVRKARGIYTSTIQADLASSTYGGVNWNVVESELNVQRIDGNRTLQVLESGIYSVAGYGYVSRNGTGSPPRYMRIMKNGTETAMRMSDDLPRTGIDLSLSRSIVLQAGDTVSVEFYITGQTGTVGGIAFALTKISEL